ncbi:MAG: hypothetical protein ACYCY6_00735 [Minisyncoccota bacterium]
MSYHRDTNNKDLGPLLIILVVLITAVGIYAVRERQWPGLPWTLGPAPTEFVLLSEAPSGMMVSGFPDEFITLVRDADIKKSAKYTIKEADSKSGETDEVLTTTFRTKASISDLFAGYVSLLNEGDYTVLRTDSQGGFTSIEGVNKIHQISISIHVVNFGEKEVRVDVRS